MSSQPGIMQLCLTLDTGGLERVAVSLANTLAARHGFRSHICTVGKTTAELIPALLNRKVVWTELSGPPHFNIRTALKLARWVRSQRIQVIHAHGTQPLVYALVVSLLCSVEIVYTKHNSHDDLAFFFKRPFFRWLATQRVKHFIGVSDTATEMLKKVFAPAAARCRTQINGTGLPSRSLRLKAQAARNSGATHAPRVIATVCRLAPEKDIATLIRAFATLRQQRGNVELWIVGDGPERGMLVELARRLDVRYAIRFWGFRGKVEQILACSDVFVNSSTTEGISISILEAMSLGLPIVATAVGGTPSIVKDGENGRLVPARSPEMLAGALLDVLENMELRRAMGERSYQSVVNDWSLERMVDNYVLLYGVPSIILPKAA